MVKKIIIAILVLGLAGIIAGAGFMYKDLRDQIQAEQLASLAARQTEPRDTQEQTEETDPDATEPVMAPDFTVVDLEGNVYRLSDFRGKPVVLNFWASWCGPCKEEMPAFEDKAAEMAGKVHFLMVNVTDGEQETLDSAYNFLLETGYTFPVYYDTAQNAAAAYGVTGIPITYFIDAEGYVIAYAGGSVDESILDKGIGMILE